MAKVKFSALVSDMRNKLNGSVFSKNRAGSYLRNKVTPINPQSIAQSTARNLLTSFSQGWKSLTQAQRDAWNSAVGSWTGTDIFGDIKTPTGLQLYIRLNVNISLAGGTPITLPPVSIGVDPVDSLALSATTGPDVFDVTASPDPVPADHALYLEATPGLSPGISNANSRFRTIAVIPAASSAGDEISAYTAKFGALTSGQKYFIRAKLIRLSTGEVSQTVVASSIAV